MSVCVLAASTGIWWVRDTGVYLWSSRRVTLTWQCSNPLFLPLTTGALHYEWWARNPVPWGTDRFLTAPPSPTKDLPSYRAAGRVHFDSVDHATFRSDAGKTLTFIRVPRGTFYDLDCAIAGPVDNG